MHSPTRLTFAVAFLLSPAFAQQKPAKPEAPKTDKPATTSVVEIAKSLQPKFKDAAYGKDSKKGEVNDATFMTAVLEACGCALDQTTKDGIVKIGELGGDAKQAQVLVEKNDAQLGGVVDMLIKGKMAKKVELADVQAGDVIQYWMKNDKKEWYGYTFVIESVGKDASGQNPKVKLYGAHEGNAAIGKGGAVGSSRFELTLKADDDRKIFLARLDHVGATKPEKSEPPKKDPPKKDPPKKKDAPTAGGKK